MKIKYLNSAGRVVNSSATIPSAHQSNLRILEDDANLRLAIMEPTRIIVEKFIEDVHNFAGGRIILNSGQAAKDICNDANLPPDTFHHGLAGSALLDALCSHSADICVIAIKLEDKKCFNYFNE